MRDPAEKGVVLGANQILLVGLVREQPDWNVITFNQS
jgi:hypothetical protein